MSLHLQPPIIYLITSGATTRASNPASEDFQNVLALVRAAVKARVSLIQLREKNLPARTLYELTALSAAITEGTTTRLLVNDRADIARAARADGVHLTTRSIEASVIRRSFGPGFLIGVSTHSLVEAQAARESGAADFAVFGPIFDTPSKRAYGSPLGLEALREAARLLSPFPLIALGGVTQENASATLRAGASGIAAIRLFNDPAGLDKAVGAIRGL
ncbi:MAG: thiamine-phosphate pyrophosphorylase [Acidobacteriota bacterium]|jgi:thiamine-phosphate pyrophosphorylase|nr:thiamine-phosphate pyrophosphorylase [Acidobacteriota bacterium]